MTDRFQNFQSLAAEMQPEKDFRIRCLDRGTAVVILAPHGGTIEPVTDLIAATLAGEMYSLYVFEALQPGRHGEMHITSHRFDEPQAVDLVTRSALALAVHGRKDDGTDTVWLGGRAEKLRDEIGQALGDAGFDASPNTRLPGLHASNICNRTRAGQGVQLELPMRLRRRLAADHALLGRFCLALRSVLPKG